MRLHVELCDQRDGNRSRSHEDRFDAHGRFHETWFRAVRLQTFTYGEAEDYAVTPPQG
jgi:hypothetical protein